MARVLITEKLAPSCLSTLRAAGHEIIEKIDLKPSELIEQVKGTNALIIRSATQVTKEVLAACDQMVVVGRAGVGLDNVDVASATDRGIMVANAPMSNIVSAAEQTLALLLATARHTPQAHSDLVDGNWNRSKYEGVELFGKTLGIVGLGRVGALVGHRAAAFGMKLLAYDPFISELRAKQLGVELVSLDQVVESAEFLTIHLPKTKETIGLFDEKLLAKCRPGAIIINTARGGIIDESALADAIKSGHIGGAGLDVFEKEPTTQSPLFGLPGVVVTPHLGASTVEAQDKAGEAIAEQVVLALSGAFVPFAVNVAVTEVSETTKPFVALAELLGGFISAIEAGSTSRSGELKIVYEGAIAEYDTKILTLAALRGYLQRTTDEQVTLVNAPLMAKEHGLEITESKSVSTHDYVNEITIRTQSHSVAGTLAGVKADVRLTMIDDHLVETRPANNMLLVRNDDRAGIVGIVGTTIGNAGVSISNMAVGQGPSGKTALMIIATDQLVPQNVVDGLANESGIISVIALQR